MTEIGRPPSPPPPPPPAAPLKTTTPQTRAPAKAAPAKKGQGPGGPKGKEARVEVASDGFSRGGVGGAGGVAVASNSGGPHAFVRFGAAGTGVLDGQLRQGGRVTVEYPLARAQVAAASGMPGSWGITVHLRFGPRPEVQERSVVAFAFVRGQPAPARPSPVTLEVPVYAQSLDIWFRQWSGPPQPAEFWDGTAEKPFAYAVKPAAVPPPKA